ncbi:methyltransferase [Maritimibacter sp. 55A14]|uniref:tRNA1(Val) (adenine(37)-N6)-methyltransferase n=1 Tax=Maritimibacter sp. 55A14 TaxID=2174844 RepID=UPI000D619FB0|nr:methyltransferase [Maritimibacter sp. 55A14]PWE32466.1 methyltransferase [Maritimibacter sp. 55A14]
MAFDEADLSRDDFLGGRLQIFQPRRGYRAATDPVLLAAAVSAAHGDTVLELGCGAGVASLCLGRRVAGVALCGLEMQADYAELARRNAVENGLAFEVVTGDVAAPPGPLAGRSFRHVMANPPWYPAGGGTPAADVGRETALREATPLAAWIDTATRRLAPRGVLTIVQQAERMPELLAALDGRMGSVQVLPLAARTGRAAGRVILRARKGGRAAFRLEAPFILHEGAAHDRDGDSYTSVAQGILRDAQPLEF